MNLRKLEASKWLKGIPDGSNFIGVFLVLALGIFFLSISIYDDFRSESFTCDCNCNCDAIEYSCDAEVINISVSLNDTNWYRNIYWLNYSCTEGVLVSEHFSLDGSPSSLYLSSWSNDDRNENNITYGVCNVTYIDVQKVI